MGENRLQLIGVGLKGPETLSPDLLEKVRQADLLAGGSKILRGFKAFPGGRIPFGGHPEEWIRKIRNARVEGKRVVVLASGDPGFFGITRLLLRFFPPEELSIHPHISSMQLAFARLRIPWDDAAFVSAHGRELSPVIETVRRASKVVILTDPGNTPSRIGKALLRAGVTDCRVFVCSRMGGDDESVWEGELSGLPGRRFSALNVMILLHDADPGGRFGIPDPELEHDAGMITKSEIRAVVLAKLRTGSNQVLWDIGAASGSVGIEAVRMAPGSVVYAVEKSGQRVAALKRNIARFAPGRVRPVRGEAPSVLRDLPDPDRVFLGGHGGHLKAILRHGLRRLNRGGRIVVSAVTLETLHEAAETFSAGGVTPEIVSLQIGRGRDLSGRVMLQAENQVFLLTGGKGLE